MDHYYERATRRRYLPRREENLERIAQLIDRGAPRVTYEHAYVTIPPNVRDIPREQIGIRESLSFVAERVSAGCQESLSLAELEEQRMKAFREFMDAGPPGPAVPRDAAFLRAQLTKEERHAVEEQAPANPLNIDSKVDAIVVSPFDNIMALADHGLARPCASDDHGMAIVTADLSVFPLDMTSLDTIDADIQPVYEHIKKFAPCRIRVLSPDPAAMILTDVAVSGVDIFWRGDDVHVQQSLDRPITAFPYKEEFSIFLELHNAIWKRGIRLTSRYKRSNIRSQVYNFLFSAHYDEELVQLLVKYLHSVYTSKRVLRQGDMFRKDPYVQLFSGLIPIYDKIIPYTSLHDLPDEWLYNALQIFYYANQYSGVINNYDGGINGITNGTCDRYTSGSLLDLTTLLWRIVEKEYITSETVFVTRTGRMKEASPLMRKVIEMSSKSRSGIRVSGEDYDDITLTKFHHILYLYCGRSYNDTENGVNDTQEVLKEKLDAVIAAQATITVIVQQTPQINWKALDQYSSRFGYCMSLEYDNDCTQLSFAVTFQRAALRPNQLFDRQLHGKPLMTYFFDDYRAMLVRNYCNLIATSHYASIGWFDRYKTPSTSRVRTCALILSAWGNTATNDTYAALYFKNKEKGRGVSFIIGIDTTRHCDPATLTGLVCHEIYHGRDHYYEEVGREFRDAHDSYASRETDLMTFRNNSLITLPSVAYNVDSLHVIPNTIQIQGVSKWVAITDQINAATEHANKSRKRLDANNNNNNSV